MQSSTKHKTPNIFSGKPASATHGGFTLVELLTVIVIIGILAGLTTTAAMMAIRTAKEATITAEISQLSLALENYKTEHGDYPPDFAGVDGGATPAPGLAPNAQTAVLRHFRKAFPRYTTGASPGFPNKKGTYAALLYDIRYAADANITAPLDPAAALVLMLGGPPAHDDSSTKLLGFSANPANPFARGGSRLPALYEFDETRIQVDYEGDVPITWPVFIPPHMPQPSSGGKAPYVYFRPRSRSYGLVDNDNHRQLPYFCQSPEQGICTPYVEQALFNATTGDINRWKEPKKFQIICAGLDGLFSDPEVLNNPVNIGNVKYSSDIDDFDNLHILGGDYINIQPDEDDNITSFTRGKLEDRPEE